MRKTPAAKNNPNSSSPVHNGPRTYSEIEPKLHANELYELEWIELYTELGPSNDLKELRRIALAQGFRTKKFRSIYWALLLNVLGEDPFSWLDERRVSRNKYVVMKERFNKNPYQVATSGTRTEEEACDDPLSQNEESVWYQHFCDQELTKLINQDVTRTFPGIEFFRLPELQATMSNILFCYARAHPQMCYRQGMHELLAPLLFVLDADQEYMGDMERLNKCINPTIFEMLDPNYQEADGYAMFAALMDRMDTYYKIRNVVPNASGEMPRTTISSNNNSSPPMANTVDELDVHIRWMRSNVLSRHDPEVEEHLTRLNIPLSVIGIRWYRLLFGREFSFLDLLTLWDAIFADKFQLIKYLPAAMLISVRRSILTSDFIGVYECLMGFQDSMDVRKLIKYSLHLQDGQKYKRPDGVFVPVPPRQIRKVEPSSSFIPRSGTLPSRSLTKRSPKTQEVLRPRANSLKRITTVKSKVNSTEIITVDHHELEISDGYLEDDPAVLKMNLEHMARVMAISRLKLQRYATELRENLQPNQHQKVFQCLDGMEELCAFMEPRPGGSVHSRNRNQTAPAGQLNYMSPPVERAYAADETFVGTTPRGSDLTSTPKTTRNGTALLVSSKKMSHVTTEFVRTLKNDCDTTITSATENPVLEENATESQTLLMTGSFLNGTHNQSSSGGSSASTEGASSSYEFPEHCTPRMAQRAIGNRREVELVEIVSSSSCSSASAGREGGGLEEVGPRREGSDFVPSTNPQMERQDSS